MSTALAPAPAPANGTFGGDAGQQQSSAAEDDAGHKAGISIGAIAGAAAGGIIAILLGKLWLNAHSVSMASISLLSRALDACMMTLPGMRSIDAAAFCSQVLYLFCWHGSGVAHAQATTLESSTTIFSQFAYCSVQSSVIFTQYRLHGHDYNYTELVGLQLCKNTATGRRSRAVCLHCSSGLLLGLQKEAC